MPAQGALPEEPGFPRLRRFEILAQLGSGNTGTIYRARARVALGGLMPGDLVALKMLHPHLLKDAAARKAFLREARAGMRVRHQSLVRIFAVEEVARAREDPRLYLVLEEVPGRTVRQWLDEEGLAQEPTLRVLGRQLAGALAALHGAGLLHLDVKPENMTWDAERAVLMDLGFARRNPEAPVRAGEGLITESGGSDALFVGTPAYAAPELLAGQRPTASVDLFALGVTLYECATGVRPFGDERTYGLFEARRTAVVRPPSAIQPRLSPFFDAVILALLAEDPARRIPSAAELARIFADGERGAWWRRHGRPAPLLPILHPGSLPFHGRGPELEQIEAAFAAARRTGRPRVVLLSGPRAIGKSRLAMEAGLRGRQRPEAPPFLYGRGLRLGRGSAFRAVRDALSRSLGLTPGEPPSANIAHRLRKALAPAAADVLLGLLAGRPYSRERRRRAFHEWFRALGREGPFLAFFDDLQATGPNMWVFMREALDLEGVPGLFLLAHRDDLEPRAAEARRALLRRATVEEIKLGPLDEATMRAIVISAFAEDGLPAVLEKDLLKAAHGNPGTLTDLLRLLVQRGGLEGQPGSLRAAGPRVGIPLTAVQADLLHTELAEMPAADRRVLLWAAMLPQPPDMVVLGQLTGLAVTRLVRRLARLRARGWLKVEGGRYRFSLPRLREAAYGFVTPREQRLRHAEVYATLRRAQEAGRRIRQIENALTLHAHRAGLHRETVQHGLPNLEARIAEDAWDRASETLKLVEKHAEALGWERLPPAERVRLLIARAHVEGARGDRVREADDLKAAGMLATEAGDAELRGLVHLALARHAHALGFPGEARYHTERARALTGRLRPLPRT